MANSVEFRPETPSAEVQRENGGGKSPPQLCMELRRDPTELVLYILMKVLWMTEQIKEKGTVT